MKGIKDYQPQEETKSDQPDNSEKLDQEVNLGPALTFADYENMMI